MNTTEKPRKRPVSVYTVTDDHVTIDIPGAFDSYFSGSSVGQGCNEGTEHPGGMGYPGGLALYTAYKASERITRGKGYSLRLTLPRDETLGDALDCLWDYADTCFDSNRDNAEGGDNEARSEMRAGDTVRARVDALAKALEAAE